MKQMHARDYLYCALHLMLDDEERLQALCPSCRAACASGACPSCGAAGGTVVEERNEGFDLARFLQMKEGAADD